MEQIFEKLSSLTIQETKNDEKNYEPKIFYKTGIINDPKMFESSEKLTEHFKFSINNLKNFTSDPRCSSIQGRMLNEEEKAILKKEDQSNLTIEGVNFSLGSSMQLIDEILNDNDITNGLGFFKSFDCLESLLAKLVLEKHKLKRILIINWDSKHNLDLQQKFYDNQKVLIISIHHFFNESSSDSDFYNIGNEQNGKGFNINVPFKKHFGDEEYMSAFYNLILPVAYEYNPQLILIPTCFNTAIESSKFSLNTYEHFLNSLSCLANGKICVLVNEKNESNKFNEYLTSSLKALFSYPCSRLRTLNEPDKNCIKSILNCITVLRPHWYCLQLLNENDTFQTLDDFLKIHIKNNEEFKTKKHDNQTIEVDSKFNTDNLNELLENLNLPDVTSRTCICSDDFMLNHFNLINQNHPEAPARIKRIISLLKERDLYDLCGKVESRYAKDEELNLCHPIEYINDLRSLKSKTINELEELSNNKNSVYYNKKTFECATLSTGCLLSVVDAVCTKKYTNGVAIVRPPGHHANSTSCSGFCFFNSISVACKYAQKNYKSMKKILILDFDVHHGNGTQEIFEDDESVLFISLHRYDNGCFYPANAPSNYTDVGRDEGKGFTVNIPWNQSNAGDGDYVNAFLKVVMPICYQFNPDLVLVSAGFDAAIGDPLGGYSISPQGYAQMTKMLSFFANGNVILALEGGYNLSSISESMCSCVSTLLGDMCPSIVTLNTKYQAFESLRNVISVQKSYWNCLKFDEKLPQTEFFKKQKKVNKTNTNNNLKPNKSEPSYSLRSRIQKTNNEVNVSDDSRESPDLITDSKPNEKDPTLIKEESKQAEQPISSSLVADDDESKKNTEKIIEMNSDISPTKSLSNKTEMEEGAAGIACGEYEMYTAVAVVPLPWCEHLELIKNKIYDPACIDAYKPCMKCEDVSENWACLSCSKIFCSRFVRGHMAEHFEETQHPLVLSFSDISVWCYVCDSYIHNQILNEVKLLAYNSKFKLK